MDILLKAENVHKAYTIGRKRVDVLRGASLTVQPGEAVAIVGASGAGKSTLLNVLGGLDEPEQGGCTVLDQEIYELSDSRRAALRAQHIGFVFQSYHLLPELDILENVLLPAMALGRGGPAARARAEELLGAVGLRHRLTHTPLELSGGEQQRAALARALMNGPELILADEPTGNLDEATGHGIMEHLFALARQRGHALVLVTHNERVAAECDRTLRLQEGLIG